MRQCISIPAILSTKLGGRLGLWRSPLPADGSPVPAQLFYERLLVQNFIGIPTPAIRRDAYLMVGGLDNAVVYCRLGPLSEDRVRRQCLLSFDSTSVLSGPQEFTYRFGKSGHSRFQKTT